MGCYPEVAVERGQWQRTTEGKFEVGGVVDGQVVAISELEGMTPAVLIRFGVDEDRKRTQMIQNSMSIRKGDSSAFYPYIKGISYFNFPKRRNSSA